jgi:hypothetical protein
MRRIRSQSAVVQSNIQIKLMSDTARLKKKNKLYLRAEREKIIGEKKKDLQVAMNDTNPP